MRGPCRHLFQSRYVLVFYLVNPKIQFMCICCQYWRNTTTALPYFAPLFCNLVALHEQKVISCLALNGCKEKVHARCCHCLALNAAFTTKVAAWPTAQASGDGLRWPLATLRKQSKYEFNETTGFNYFAPERYSLWSWTATAAFQKPRRLVFVWRAKTDDAVAPPLENHSRSTFISIDLKPGF